MTYKTFTIPFAIYNYSTAFVITKDFKRALKFINKDLDLPCKDFIAFKDTEFNCRGKMFYRPDYCPVVWLPAIPKTPEEIGVAVHEINHAIYCCMRWMGSTLSESSEEAYCHLLSYTVAEFFKKIK